MEDTRDYFIRNLSKATTEAINKISQDERVTAEEAIREAAEALMVALIAKADS